MFVSQALQVLIVSLAIGGFFVALGVLAIDPAITEDWTGSAANALLEFDLFGHEAILSEELLRVAGASPPSRASTSRSRCSPTTSTGGSSWKS